MQRVKVVTAYVDLGLTKRPSESFHALGDQLRDTADAADADPSFFRLNFSGVWSVQEFWPKQYPPANPRAEDRFVNQEEHLRSNLIQHMPMQMLGWAAERHKKYDVFVWMGYSILKQGAFTGRPVTPAAITRFIERVREYPFDDIPIPSIRPDDPISPYGDNWQVVGSTIIAPRKFLWKMKQAYEVELRAFVEEYKAIPLDLAIWPAVVRNSGLPFRTYPAEYDATQLTNFP